MPKTHADMNLPEYLPEYGIHVQCSKVLQTNNRWSCRGEVEAATVSGRCHRNKPTEKEGLFQRTDQAPNSCSAPFRATTLEYSVKRVQLDDFAFRQHTVEPDKLFRVEAPKCATRGCGWEDWTSRLRNPCLGLVFLSSTPCHFPLDERARLLHATTWVPV